MRRSAPWFAVLVAALAYPIAVLAGGGAHFPSRADCVHVARADGDLKVVFGRFEYARDASSTLDHVLKSGFKGSLIEPDDPKWIHRDEDVRVPTQAWVHRARYIGPKGRRPAEELHGKEGLPRLATHAKLASRRLLVPDENVSWNLTAIPAAIRIARA